MNWQPIETAPKDGTAILGWAPSQDIIVVNWTGWGGGVWETDSGDKCCADSPTHWMPLPDPPDA